jgi:hypothetical protein
MTCIVALVHEGHVYFGADSLTVSVPSQYHSGVSQTVRKEPKIFRKQDITFGYNGDVRMGQILTYLFEFPEYVPGKDKVVYLVQEFIPALMECLKKHEYPTDDLGGGILLALGGEIFHIGSSFGICGTKNTYDSIGKASQVALGSLHATEQLVIDPRRRLFLALEATEIHTCVVSKPFWWLTEEMDQAEVFYG